MLHEIYQLTASNFTADAGLLTSRGQSAQQAGYMAGGGSLLTGASGAAEKWFRFDAARRTLSR